MGLPPAEPGPPRSGHRPLHSLHPPPAGPGTLEPAGRPPLRLTPHPHGGGGRRGGKGGRGCGRVLPAVSLLLRETLPIPRGRQDEAGGPVLGLDAGWTGVRGS